MKNEQYSRKNNLKIFGLVHNEGENCAKKMQKMVKEKLKINVAEEDVEIAHRLPASRQENQEKAVIVKFRNPGVRYAILKARRALKGTGISICEDISASVLSTLKSLRENPNTKDAWCWNGKIFIKDQHDKMHSFGYGTAIPEFFIKQ